MPITEGACCERARRQQANALATSTQAARGASTAKGETVATLADNKPFTRAQHNARLRATIPTMAMLMESMRHSDRRLLPIPGEPIPNTASLKGDGAGPHYQHAGSRGCQLLPAEGGTRYQHAGSRGRQLSPAEGGTRYQRAGSRGKQLLPAEGGAGAAAQHLLYR